MANSSFGNNSLILYIAGDTTGLQTSLAKAKTSVTNFGREVEATNAKVEKSSLFGAGLGRGGKLNQGLRGAASGLGLGSAALFGSGAFIGTALSLGALQKSVVAASDLNEQITKTQQVFGDSSKAVIAWSKDTATSMGIAQEAALQSASTFGNLFKAQGFGDIQNSNLSKGLVKLAADLASFNNVDINQVLQDLQSGIVGEIEPVRKYGSDLRVARVQLQALSETGKTSVKQLTQQELTLARIHLLYRDTAAAQGDFQRTSGGLANQQRILTAQIQNLAASMGTLLLPAIDVLVTDANVALRGINKLADGLKSLAGIKIPPIHIPIFTGGGGGGGVSAGDIAKGLAFAGALPEVQAAIIVKKISDHFIGSVKNAANTNQAQLATDMEDIISPYFSNAMTEALRNLQPPQNFAAGFAATNITTAINKAFDFFHGAIKRGIKQAKTGVFFSNLLDNLQLGVERSQISGSLQNQLAALEALRDGLGKQIKAGIDVQSSQHQLAGVEAQIVNLQQQIKQNGISKVIGVLQTAVDRATLTKSLNDDLRALEALSDGLRAQIKAGNDVENNTQQLVGVLKQIQDTKATIAQNVRTAQQSSLFKLIGLSATGGEIVPGVANLKKQFDQLTSQDLSGVAKKLINRLAGVAKALSSPFLKAQPEVRSAIAELFKSIRDELNKQTSTGPLTKTSSLNTNKILKGLGLDAASTRELRARLSSFNSAGLAIAGSGVVATGGGFPVVGGATQVNVDVTLDGQKLAKSVTVHQQKRANRNPAQKRGPIGGKI